jgi:protein-tyrosine phosphatase
MTSVTEILPFLYMGDKDAAQAMDNPPYLHVALAPCFASEQSKVVLVHNFSDNPTWNWRKRQDKFNELREAAIMVAEAVDVNRSALVTCNMGQNRSGLVVGLALCALGFGPRQAIYLIRKKRGDVCLNNLAFERCLMEFGASMKIEGSK